jgi:DNA topoisomerase VI subunit A
MVGCTRSSLNVVASEKGIVVGQVQCVCVCKSVCVCVNMRI